LCPGKDWRPSGLQYVLSICDAAFLQQSVPQIHWGPSDRAGGAGPLAEDMVSETIMPERRAGLRPISRPSQMAFGVALLAVVSGCFTYALLTDLLPYKLGRAGQIALLVFNLALVLSLAAAIGWRIARLMATRRSGRAGAKLHVRLVTWFSAIAVVPVILVAIFAAVTLNLGLD